MDWQQLRGFYHVATLGSFTKAAALMFRSQSTLSQQIMNLEEECGCQLLDRVGKRHVTVTSSGKCMLNFVEDIMLRYDKLAADLEQIKHGQIGTVRVTMAPATSLMLMPDIIQKFRTTQSDISLILYERMPSTVIDMVSKRLSDFGVGMASITPSSFESHILCSAHFLLLVPEDHPLTQKNTVTMEDLAQLFLIVPPETQNFAARHKLMSKATNIGINLNIILESNNIPSTAEYVRRNLGIGFLSAPVTYKSFNFKGLSWIPMDHLFEPDNICLFFREKTLETLPAQTFYKHMKTCCNTVTTLT